MSPSDLEQQAQDAVKRRRDLQKIQAIEGKVHAVMFLLRCRHAFNLLRNTKIEVDPTSQQDKNLKIDTITRSVHLLYELV